MPEEPVDEKYKRAKRPDGASTNYFGKDGYRHGRVTVGVRDDGKPDRRHVMTKVSKAEIVKTGWKSWSRGIWSAPAPTAPVETVDETTSCPVRHWRRTRDSHS